MQLKWLDIQDIAISLTEKYPDTDPQTISFPDLYQRVLELEEFEDDPKHAGEKILEAIQMAWIDEQD
ncbi:Fe-S cluster assembly protein IscX [Candidatus Venteria ishoeyi]|uniref:FeS assembly protein IscX n=1 Tax=Candidatus Venteria ishoeyi TaxID=1899563 RepID=A0A1H6FE48_9GAMM|nr:Fe-S cluster assembly protein IscX [Candidatus Venteria ishoeyi]MDM8545887.1 Fe-S cluster assembly protein IscX [Candidatus Venteria ishoeyi]SEH08348.1 Uncharacterised protein [Candidatus Venteria ishoeyi]